MKQIAKRKLTGRQILLIVLASLLVVLSTAYAIVTAVLSGTGETADPGELPEILEGESHYLNTPIAYPRVSESEITYILVKNEQGMFDLTRWPGQTGSFWLSYDVGEGTSGMVEYIPPIVGAEGDFDYESLYAAENNSGYGQAYLLTYLCSAIGTTYFKERIPLASDDDEERELLLREYGFKSDKTATIAFAYNKKNSDGSISEESHAITLGGNAVSGSGYYFMVDNRDYIYYSGTGYFDYAMKGFTTFIKGMLVAEGLAEDNAFEPYLTSDFKQWANELHKAEEDKVVTVTEGAQVIVKGQPMLPLNAGVNYVPPDGAPTDGYQYPKSESMNFDLDALKKHPDYKRIASILVGLEVGKSYVDDRLLITLVSELSETTARMIDFGDKDSVKYSYMLTAVESILTDSGEILPTDGADVKVGDNNLVKVSYHYYIDGESANALECHAVLDLTSELLPSSAVDAIRAASLGRLPAVIEFDIEYTKDNSLILDEKLIIKDIVNVYDKNGKRVDTVAEDSYVTIRYYEVINGNETDLTSMTLSISEVDDNEKWDVIKAALVGQKKGNDVDITVYSEKYQYEIFRDFTSYQINEVEYFITSELITSFKFCNSSERDPYYGESIYENTLDNEYRFYGLNSSSCENVVKYLGGVGTSGTTSSAGFAGDTVALGLTHKNMEKYGLYAHHIYFELPRGISDISEGEEFDDEDELSDFAWIDTLGFNLYISDKMYDTETGMPYRYVGSDMYDLIARVDGDEFDFLEFGFVEFWARQNMLLMNISVLEQMQVEFNMEDLYGEYSFEVDHTTIYLGTDGNQMFASEEYFEGATEAEKLYVYVSATGERIDTVFEELLKKSDDGRVSISNIYNVVNNQMHKDLVNTLGVSNFKDVYEIIQLTSYQDTLTEEEQAEALLTAPLMTIRIKIEGTAYYYTYDFHRFDDRRVMVRLYQTNSQGEPVTNHVVSDFYITTFTFKKLASNFKNLLNGVIINGDVGYLD